MCIKTKRRRRYFIPLLNLNTRTGSCAFTADEKDIKDRRNKTLPVVDNKRGITKGIKGLTTLYIMLKPTFLLLFYPLLSPITHFYFCFLSTSPFLERPWSFSFLIFAISPPPFVLVRAVVRRKTCTLNIPDPFGEGSFADGVGVRIRFIRLKPYRPPSPRATLSNKTCFLSTLISSVIYFVHILI